MKLLPPPPSENWFCFVKCTRILLQKPGYIATLSSQITPGRDTVYLTTPPPPFGTLRVRFLISYVEITYSSHLLQTMFVFFKNDENEN